MKELNNNSIVLNASTNQQLPGVSQQKTARTRSEGYLKYTSFAARHRKDGDVLVKFRDPKNTASGLRAANVKDDGFFGCDIIGPLFRTKGTKAINNNVRKDFVQSIVDSFEGAGDFNLFHLDDHDLEELKLKDFIGKDKLAKARETGCLTLRDLLGENQVTTGKPLSARRITAINDVFTRFERSAKPKLEGDELNDCLVNLFKGSASFNGKNFQERLRGEVEGREIELTIDFDDQDAGNQQGVQEVKTNNETALKKLDTIRKGGFISKMLAQVSWYGVDVFSFKDIRECDSAGVKPHGTVSINLTIKKGTEPGMKDEAEKITLVVSESGDDRRAACRRTVKFTLPENFFWNYRSRFESVEIIDS